MLLTPEHVAIAVVLGYLFGSIPTGMIIARVYRNVDLTAYGSGRTGTTNVLRTLGRGAAVLAFVGDFLKGMVPVLIVRVITGGNTWVELLTAAAAVVGSSYSIFIGFKGGRGVTTGLGATVIAAPLVMVAAVVSGVLIILITRYVSLGSVVGSLVGGLLLVAVGVYTGEPALVVWGVLLSGFIVVAHRDNIERLMTGTERKLGEGAQRI